MSYAMYKTINMVNNTECIGLRKIKSTEDILFVESENGSIFKDGYLGSGNLIKEALERYGPLNMKQELILIADDEDAIELEKEIVGNWVKREDVSMDGNVAILFGETDIK